MKETIKLGEKGKVSYITLNRPGVLNALDLKTLDHLCQTLVKLEADSRTGVILITGSGEKAFCVGADVNEVRTLASDSLRGKDFSTKFQSSFSLIEGLKKPVIAAINGLALGAGFELAMACHIRIASQMAQFGLPELKLGGIPAAGGTQRLPKLIGLGRAMEMILSGRRIDAGEAYRIGLVSEVTELKDLLPTAHRLAEKILENAPIALRFAIEAIYKGYGLPLEAGLALEANLSGLVCSTKGVKEGVTAFFEKRKPEFVKKKGVEDL